MGKPKKFYIENNIGIKTTPYDRDTYNRYSKDIYGFKPLSREEEIEIFKELKLTNSQKLKDKICKHNLSFVISVAKKYSTYTAKSIIKLEDLIAEGNMGLYTAIDKFDYTTENKFISYAIWHIRANILKCIQDNIKSVRIPPNVQTKLRNLELEHQKMEQKKGEKIEFQEVFYNCKKLGMFTVNDDFTRMFTLVSNNNSDRSLSEVLNDDYDTELGETIPSYDINPHEIVENKEFKKLTSRLFETVSTIKKIDKNLIMLHYGLYDEYKKLTTEEIVKIEKNIKDLEKDKKEKEKIHLKVKGDIILKKQILTDLDELDEIIFSLKIQIKASEKKPLSITELSEIYNMTGANVRIRMKKCINRIRNENRSNRNYFMNNI